MRERPVSLSTICSLVPTSGCPPQPAMNISEIARFRSGGNSFSSDRRGHGVDDVAGGVPVAFLLHIVIVELAGLFLSVSPCTATARVQTWMERPYSSRARRL